MRTAAKAEVLYRGIAARAFERAFQLADFVQVKNASLENGLLHVDLVREIPEAKKPRSIPISVSGAGAAGGRRLGRESRSVTQGRFQQILAERKRPGKPGRFFVVVPANAWTHNRRRPANSNRDDTGVRVPACAGMTRGQARAYSSPCAFGMSWVGRICGAGLASTGAATAGAAAAAVPVVCGSAGFAGTAATDCCAGCAAAG